MPSRLHLPTRRRPTAALLAAVAVSVVCFALGAASASAAVPFQFVGTQSSADPTESELERLGEAEVQTFRVQLSWAAVEPEKPTGCTSSRCTGHSYRWSRYDQMFEHAARNGVRLVPVLLGSPSWASSDSRWVPTYGKPGYATWKRQSFYDFAKAAAARYGTQGTFWTGKDYGVDSVRARYWQVWNEPNLPNYWWNQTSGSKTAVEYGQLLVGTDAALRAGDSRALTLSAGLPWSSSASLDPPPFLKTMFKSKPDSAAATDFVAIHPYARTPGLVIEGVRLTRSALNSTAASSRPIWLTEFGWAQSGPSSAFTVDVPTQARYLRDTYRGLLRYRTTYRIQGGIWFNLINVKRSPDRWYYHTGLFRSDRVTPWDSWWAMRCVTQGGTNFCRYGAPR